MEQQGVGQRFASILGESPPMRQLKELLERIAASPAPVLVLGESGTGKEVVARALHRGGPRSQRPFVVENCAALPEVLLESELFGHARGAFAGAFEDRAGLFEAADGGTLFLDEIAEIPSAVQAKLLRVLEGGEIRRLGESRVRRVDARVVATTSRDLPREVEEGRFRPELYYRLCVLVVEVPPLRQRREDVPLLARHFLADYARRAGKSLPGFADEVLEALQCCDWPGNVRQLRNEVERMGALAESSMLVPCELLSPTLRGSGRRACGSGESLPQAMRRIKRELIAQALGRCQGNRSRAARQLGISRPNLQQTMKRLGLE